MNKTHIYSFLQKYLLLTFYLPSTSQVSFLGEEKVVPLAAFPPLGTFVTL